MSVTDELLQNNESYAQGFDKGELGLPPAKGLVVIACMDARLIPTRVLGLEEGDAHVIRNAGGVVTDDTIRSLAISQHLLGTHEVVLIHHTDCGMLTFTDDDFGAKLEEATGERPPCSLQSPQVCPTARSRKPSSGALRRLFATRGTAGHSR